MKSKFDERHLKFPHCLEDMAAKCTMFPLIQEKAKCTLLIVVVQGCYAGVELGSFMLVGDVQGCLKHIIGVDVTLFLNGYCS